MFEAAIRAGLLRGEVVNDAQWADGHRQGGAERDPATPAPAPGTALKEAEAVLTWVADALEKQCEEDYDNCHEPPWSLLQDVLICLGNVRRELGK